MTAVPRPILAEDASIGAAVLSGVRGCVGVPMVGIFLTMVGFGVMARDGGLSALEATVATLAIWGISGQVAMVEMHQAGADALAICIAAGLANLRMLPITISGLPLITAGRPTAMLVKLGLVQTTSVTGWTHIQSVTDKVPAAVRLPHYLGFTVTLTISALVGTAVGHVAGAGAPPPVLTVAVFLTPLYLFLLVASARQEINQLAVLLGGLLGVPLYPLVGDWAVAASGLGGGTAAFLIWRRKRARDAAR